MNFSEPVPRASRKELLRSELEKLQKLAKENMRLWHKKEIDDDEYDRRVADTDGRMEEIREENPDLDAPDPEPFERYLGKYDVDEEGYVSVVDLADVVRSPINRVADMVRENAASAVPYFGAGLRIEDYGGVENYKIHKDDIQEFLKRFKEFYED